MRIDEWTRRARALLGAAGFEEAKLESELLAAFACGISRSQVIAFPELAMDDALGEELLARRLNHEPLAYIIGSVEFYGRRFKVNPAVLIPRQDTETLIEAALSLSAPQTVLDIGTGSGCIAITLACERPSWQVSATDLSPVALEVASENNEAFGGKVRLKLGDLARPFDGEKFDLVVSNPPYIPSGTLLEKQVQEFEPGLALFGGESGLEIYERMAAELPVYLAPGGTVILEIGYDQGETVPLLFREQGWTVHSVQQDFAGRDRIVLLGR